MIRHALTSPAVVVAVVAVSALAGAVELPVMPPSLVSAAAVARAASIVVRVPEDQGDRDFPSLELEADEDRERIAARRRRTLGAGVIVDPRGYAVTSARAVLLVPDIEIASIDGAVLKATLVGLDRPTDVALLKLDNDGAPLPYLPLGDSTQVNVGDWVIAVGPLRGFEGTVTAGIIAALPAPASRSPIAGFLQTDAAVGPASAGGPLVSAAGEVIGLVSVLHGDGVGYVLPSRTLRTVYLELMENGRVSRPWLGARPQSLTVDLARALRAPDGAGVLIADVLPDSPAARAGLRSGDIIVEIDGTNVSARAQYDRAIGTLSPGQVARLRVRREAREFVASVRVGEEPQDWKLPPGLARTWQLLGLEARAITPTMGAIVVTVDPSSAAARAGVEPGDVIREMARRTVHAIADLEKIAATLRPGAEVLILVQRGEAAYYVVVPARR